MTSFSIILFIGVLFGLFLGVFVLVRDRHSLVHWTFAVGMMAFAAEGLFIGLSLYASTAAEAGHWLLARHVATAILPCAWLVFSLSLGRVNQKESVLRWKWIVFPISILPLFLLGFFANSFFTGRFYLSPPSFWQFEIGWSGYLFYLVLIMSFLFILMNLERVHRSSVGHIRWQIKFMVLGLGGLFAVRIYTVSQVVLFRVLDLSLEWVNASALVVAGVLILRSLRRSGMLNVSLYPSQSLLYNSITLLIAGIYFLVVGVIAKMGDYFGIGRYLPFKAFFVFLALLGFSILLLSDRFRLRLKRLISRHLKRPLYDYRKEWAGFTRATTSVTEATDLCSRVAKMVCRTFDILSVTVWLLDSSREQATVGGTTLLCEERAEELESAKKEVMEYVRTLRLTGREGSSFDNGNGEWASEANWPEAAGYHLKKGACLRIPLVASGRLLGLMSLSERVGGESFSIEEFDLLKTIADQTAASLLNLMLAENLRQAKEMEAFQTMSAFFMHDLKNLGSRLSLVVQNLPVYYDNQDFRSDALQTISQSVSKINTMCNRLSLLSQKIELKPGESDLNELVRTALSGLNGVFREQVIEDLHPVQRIAIDSEQIEKVFVNLLLNAHEALVNGGVIRVVTEQCEDCIVLSVCDNGCGMSKEFIEKSLFRPFKTTKKQGMGIGLLQSKMIVEAHKGRIEVESEEGRGTTFRVLLPVEKLGRSV
jgi:putative PEP-CTERM system histidine kinase